MLIHDDNLRGLFTDALDALIVHMRQSRSAELPASGYAPLGELIERLGLERLIQNGDVNETQFHEFLAGFLAHSVQLHHPLHIAHQVAVPTPASALAQMINGFLNNPMAIYEMGPAAAAIEFVVVNWMLEKIGWPVQPRIAREGLHHGGGVLTHGGSLANMTALLAARARIAPEAWEEGVPSDLTVLVSPVAHYSVARAVAMLGLGEKAIVPLPCDRLGRVLASKVAPTIHEVQKSGRRVMAVMANVCATATGLHDPVREMGTVCREQDIWYHVDACHGASALLHNGLSERLDGIELADAVVWDAHKMLQVSALCAAVLFRDHQSFEIAFSQEASYLAYGHDEGSYDSLPRAVECTKAPLGVKLFFNLMMHGEQALGDFVADRYAMATTAYELINARARFECPIVPESNIVCFRVDGDDELQQSIRDELVRERVAHITTATVAGKTHLRFTIMNPATDEEAINAVLDLIERKAFGD